MIKPIKTIASRLWFRLLLFAFAYFLLAYLSGLVSFRGSSFPTIWFPSGLFVAVLLICPVNTWPVYMLAALPASLVYSLMAGQSLPISLLVYCSSLLEASTGAWLIQRFQPKARQVQSPTHILAILVFPVLISSALNALMNTTVLAMLDRSLPYWPVWRINLISHGLGILVITPLILSWKGFRSSRHTPLNLEQVIELAILTIGLFICSLYIFVGNVGVSKQSYIVAPFLIWGALRFGMRGAAIMGLIITLVSTWGITGQVSGIGYNDVTISLNLEALGSFLSITLGTSYILATVWMQKKRAEEALRESQARFQTLFDHSPVPIWEEDFSRIKNLIDNFRHDGVENFREFFSQHPEHVEACDYMIRILDVNQAAMQQFEFTDKSLFLSQVNSMVHRGPLDILLEELIAIAEGKTEFEMEGPNDLVNGIIRYHYVHWTVAPGHEEDYQRVIVTIIDITERKQAEERMRYLSTHDVLTRLYNRNFFEAEMERLQNSRLEPVNVMLVDVNGMKSTNDTYGHAAGDELLRRTAQVLRTTFRKEDIIARIGGDEFVVLFHGPISTSDAACRVRDCLSEHNLKYADMALSLSIGAVSGGKGSSLFELFKKADQLMYKDKLRSRKPHADGKTEIKAGKLPKKI